MADGAGDHGMQIFDLTRLRDVQDPPALFEPDVHYTGINSSHNVIINEDTGFESSTMPSTQNNNYRAPGSDSS